MRRTRPALVVGLLLALGLSGCGRAPQPRHAILITIDTLRPDRLGAYGHTQARTPHLDALAATGVRFERAYAHSSMTVPSMASLFTSLPPRDHGIQSNDVRLAGDLPSLPSELERAGFEAGAFIGSYALRPRRGFERGFATYTSEYGAVEQTRKHPENLAGPLTDAAIAWMAARAPEQRLFLWIHYQEPHGPYTPPSFEAPVRSDSARTLRRGRTNSGRSAIPKYQWLGHGRLDEYQARYEGEIAAFDVHLGRLVAALDAHGILEQSALVLTSDHGEAFGEDDLFCAHGEGLSDALLRVPLVLRAPGIAPGVRSDRVRLIDVAPTMLGLLGLEPNPEFTGQSLLEETEDRRVVAQVRSLGDEHWRAVHEGGYALVENRGGATRVQAPEGAETPPAIRARLEALLEREAPWPGEAPPIELDDDERDALRALGYIE